MRALLELPERPMAVFAAADMMAIGAIRVAQAAGPRVPEDVAGVGFDDIEASTLLGITGCCACRQEYLVSVVRF